MPVLQRLSTAVWRNSAITKIFLTLPDTLNSPGEKKKVLFTFLIRVPWICLHFCLKFFEGLWKLLGKHFLRLKWCFDVSENSNYTGCEFWKQQPQNKGWSQHKIWAVNYYKGNRDSSFNFPARHLNVFLQHLAPNLWIMVEAQALPKSHCYFCWQKHYGQSRFWGDIVWHTSTKIRYS